MSVTIDGVNLKDLGIRVLLDTQYPATPSTRDKTVTIPNRHGNYDFGAYFDSMPHELECRVFAQGHNDIQTVMRNLKELLLDEYARPKDVQLVYDFEPDKYYTVRLQGNVPLQRLVMMGEFTLPLMAHDPIAYSNVYSDEVKWGSEVITFQSNYLLGHEGSDGQVHITSPITLEFDVDGYAVRPTIEISGSADSLTLDSGTKSFTLNNFNNSNWVIDGQYYTVLKDGQNAFAEMKGDFLWLNRGQNTITVTGNNLDVDIYVKFRDQYL